MANIFKHTAIYSIGRIVGKAVGFFMIPLYTHYLTPEDYGTFEMLSMLALVGGIMIQGGISSAIFKFWNSYNELAHQREVVSSIYFFVLLMSAAFSCIALFSSEFISYLLFGTKNANYYVQLMVLSFFFSTNTNVPETYLQVKKQSKLFAIISLLILIIGLGLNIYLVVIAKMGLKGILYSSIITRCIHASMLAMITLPEVKLGVDIAKIRNMLAFSLPLIPAEIGMFIFSFSDRLFLSHMASLRDVGIYSLGLKFSFMLSVLIIQPFMQVWEQVVYELRGKENAAYECGRVFTNLYLVVTIAALIMSVFIPEVVQVISSPQFHPAWKIVPVLSLGYVFRAIYYYYRTGLFYESKTSKLGRITFVSAALSLVLNLIFVPWFGALGASTAKLIAYIILALSTYISVRESFQIKLEIRKIIYITVTCALGYCAFGFIFIQNYYLTIGCKCLVIPFMYILLVKGNVIRKYSYGDIISYIRRKETYEPV